MLQKFKTSYILLIILVSALQSTAQSYQGLDAVKLVNAVNGDSISLDYGSNESLVALIFTSNYCPYSRKYEDRINELYQKYRNSGVQFLLINPNNTEDDSLEEMKKKASNLGYRFPYLKDDQQVLTDIMGATRTPEVFLLKPVNNGFELVYHGAIDDNPLAAIDVQNPYLESAIDSVLNANPVGNSEVRVTGCIIKN